jgi:hypothetical protein
MRKGCPRKVRGSMRSIMGFWEEAESDEHFLTRGVWVGYDSKSSYHTLLVVPDSQVVFFPVITPVFNIIISF